MSGHPAAVNAYMPTALVVAEAVLQAMDRRARDGKRRCVQYESFAGGVGDGVGAAIERSPEDVVENVRQFSEYGLETARNDYGVAIRANGGQVGVARRTRLGVCVLPIGDGEIIGC